MDIQKCLLFVLSISLTSASSFYDDNTVFDKGYRTIHRLYEDCQQRNVGVANCLKKKAIIFFERLGRIDHLPISENLELVRLPQETIAKQSSNNTTDFESTLGRMNSGSKEDTLNELLFDRIASLMNGFNVQIRLPKTSSDDLKRSVEEGRGKMKKMMGMMMMGMAMKMAAMVPLAMGVLFLLAGKALIISKIALVLSMIIGLKKLLGQKQNDHGGHGGGWQQGGGGSGTWDRSLKGFFTSTDHEKSAVGTEYVQNIAYNSLRQ